MSIVVMSRPGEPAEKLLQRFKRMCMKEGVLRELRTRRFYEKPSQRRRRLAKAAARAVRKAGPRGPRRSARRT